MATTFKEQFSQILRDTMHNYVIKTENELDDSEFFQRLKGFIVVLEGCRYEAYYDGISDPENAGQYISMADFYSLSDVKQRELVKEAELKKGKSPIVTVGIGLNIESRRVRERYDRLLGQPGLMEKVYKGEMNLTEKHVEQIFMHSVQSRFKELKPIYRNVWRQLKANERICIHSLYFNYPKLANGSSNFHKLILKYVETSDEKYLEQAIHEVSVCSNPKKDAGIQNRRDAEAIILSSYECPTYTKPCQSSDSYNNLVVTLNKTRVPRGVTGRYDLGINKDYFIWRTCMDEKVRAEHLVREGQVFRYDNPPGGMRPGKYHNCRCHEGSVPDHVRIHDHLSEQKAFDLYLRKGVDVYRENLRKISTVAN